MIVRKFDIIILEYNTQALCRDARCFFYAVKQGADGKRRQS
jgi:hypothetical protein